MRLSHSQRTLLEKATEHYQNHLQEAVPYLEKRGLNLEDAQRLRLGVVRDPLPGHERFVGRLSIPYITPTGIVDIRFRAIGPEEPKYLGLPGATTHVYNVKALVEADNHISICEGEIDAMTLHLKVGIPAIGVPGANSWKSHYRRLLSDFDTIYVFADGDQAGGDFSKNLAKEMQGVVVLSMPEGEDVNSMYLSKGRNYFIERIAR